MSKKSNNFFFFADFWPKVRFVSENTLIFVARPFFQLGRFRYSEHSLKKKQINTTCFSVVLSDKPQETPFTDAFMAFFLQTNAPNFVATFFFRKRMVILPVRAQ